MGEWQPIGTAPKNGTAIEVKYLTDDPRRVCWLFGKWQLEKFVAPLKFEPTHWRPLPVTPDTECHCGKYGHALNSVNCPAHGHQWAADEINLLRKALTDILDASNDPYEIARAALNAVAGRQKDATDGPWL